MNIIQYNMKLNYQIVNYATSIVINNCKMYNIDESHALRHSLDVFHNAVKIYETELFANPFLRQQQNEIFCAAILHDTCDKKYVDSQSVLLDINSGMSNYLSGNEIKNMNQIINTISYSYVKKNGFPNLQNYNLAYHIVREADLLAAYDVERCIVYQMMHDKFNYSDSLKKTFELFDTRMFNYISDGLFITNYSKERAQVLHKEAEKRISILKNIEKSFEK